VKHNCIFSKIQSTAAKSVNILDAMHYIKMSWDNVTKDTIKNCFQKYGFKSEESEEICEISEGDDEYDENFLQYVHNDKKNLLILIEISDSEIVEQILPSQVSIRPASEDENSDEDEEPDPPPTYAADARKALHTL
jgi:hypothetical protein